MCVCVRVCVNKHLSYDAASEGVITSCIKNDNSLVDKICRQSKVEKDHLPGTGTRIGYHYPATRESIPGRGSCMRGPLR